MRPCVRIHGHKNRTVFSFVTGSGSCSNYTLYEEDLEFDQTLSFCETRGSEVAIVRSPDDRIVLDSILTL